MVTSTSINCGSGQHYNNRTPLNFSSVWISYQENVLGYVGNDYQRFYFLIDSIKVNAVDTTIYDVWGKYRIKEQINIYEGQIRVVEYTKLPPKHRVRESHPLSNSQLYCLISEWDLKTKGNEEKIKGKMQSSFIIINGKAVFDEMNLEYSDSYCNNQFVGILSSKTSGEQKCRWGTFRIPDSDELDIGAAEFSPNEKYLPYGWQSYHDAFIEGTEKGWQKEDQDYWNLQHYPLQMQDSSEAIIVTEKR